tara:strand:- start:16217 stop:17071 length:855 start_codon:yes stop_codon:yes gene_type:complete
MSLFLKQNETLLFCFFLFFNFQLISGQKKIKAMSYNVRYENFDDGENQWDQRKKTLIDYLKSKSPSIIGMQEVISTQLLDLNFSLSEYSFVGIGREDGKIKGEFCPIFFNKYRFELIESETFWLSETPEKISVGWDAALERICTYVRLKDLENNREFWVFNTHFDHIGVKARNESVELILKKIKEVNNEKIPILITGDFNLIPEKKPIKRLQSLFQDILADLNIGDPKYGTFNGFKEQVDSPQRIDYIFQNGFKVLKSEHLWIKTPKGLWASDHHPVYLECLFK